MESRKSDLLLKGIGVSPGIIIGKVFLFDPSEIEVFTIPINTEEEINQEIKRFKLSLNESKQQLLTVKKEVEHKKHKEAQKTTTTATTKTTKTTKSKAEKKLTPQNNKDKLDAVGSQRVAKRFERL